VGAGALHSLTIVVGINLRINNIKCEIESSYGSIYFVEIRIVLINIYSYFWHNHGRFNSQTTRLGYAAVYNINNIIQ